MTRCSRYHTFIGLEVLWQVSFILYVFVRLKQTCRFTFDIERFTRMKQTMDDGIKLLSESNDYSGFAGIFGELLIDYYDPMYAYQLSKKADRISFTGSREEVLDYLLDEKKLSA